jgi:hypothetical protein
MQNQGKLDRTLQFNICSVNITNRKVMHTKSPQEINRMQGVENKLTEKMQGWLLMQYQQGLV